jgi:hypothetical protein
MVQSLNPVYLPCFSYPSHIADGTPYWYGASVCAPDALMDYGNGRCTGMKGAASAVWWGGIGIL